jgi:hypothetical protein
MPIAVPFLTGHKQLSIELAEPVVLLRGPPTDPTTQVLRGEVHLFLSKPMTAQQTVVKLVGKSKMSWPEGLGTRGTKVYHEKVILEQSVTLDTRSVDQPTLPAGLNRWPFEFLIPNKVVETIEDDLATVQYYIVAVVKRSGLGAMNLNIKTRRNILLLRTLSGSEHSMASNSLPATSIVVERQTDFGDATIYIEKSIASSGTQFPISIVLTAQKKNLHVEAISVMLVEKRVYRVPEYNARRAELHDFKLHLASVSSMADSEQMKQAMVPSSDISLSQIRRVITTKNAHIPLGDTPFQYKFVFTLPNCLTLNHTTWYKEMNFLHHLKLDIEISTGTAKERKHIYLETPITILDCRLKEDFTTLPTYQQSLSDTTVDAQDELDLLNKRDGYFICPCYVDYKKKSKDKSGKEVIRQQNASSSSPDLPPPDYATLDSKI